jgi:exonuclease SbcC
MKILKLRGRNINSLKGDFSIDFTAEPLADCGIFAITGPTGSGKTTLLDTICLAMYNAVPRRSNPREDVMTKHTADCMAEVEFAIEDEVYRSSWTQRRSYGKADGNLQQPKMELSKLKNGEFEIEETHIGKVLKRIEEITGLDYARFGQSIMLAQGSFMAFLIANDNDRANLLEKMTGTEIYAEISKIAYQKAGVEQEKLNNLRQQLKSFEILTEEQIETLNSEVQKNMDELKAADVSLQKLKADISSFNDFKKTVMRLEELKQNLAAAQAELKSSEAVFSSLELYENSERARHLLKDKERFKLEFEKNQSSLKKLSENREKLLEQLQFCQAKKEKADKENCEFSQKYPERLGKIEKAKIKDQQLANEIDKKKLVEKELEALTKDREVGEKRLEELIKELSLKKSKKEKIEKQLSESISIEKIEREIPFLEDLLQKIAIARKAIESELAIEKELEQQITDLKKHEAKLTELLAEAEKELEIRQKNLSESRAEKDRIAVEVNLEGLKQKSNDLENRIDNLKELIEQKNVFFETEAGCKELQISIDQLKTAISKVNDSLKLCESEQKTALARVEEIEKKLRLENKIVELDEERQKLVEGQPCPLCGSLEHPLAKQVGVDIDRTAKELAAAREMAEELQKKALKLVAEVSGKQGNLESDEKTLKKLEKSLAKLSEKLKELEKKENLRENISGKDVEELLAIALKELEENEKIQKRIEELSRLVASNEALFYQSDKALSENKIELSKLHFEIQKRSDSLEACKEKTSARNDEILQMNEKIAGIFQSLGVESEEHDYDRAFEALKLKAQQLRDLAETLHSLDDEIGQNGEKMQNLQISLTETKSRQTETEKNSRALTDEIARISHERNELLGDENTEKAMRNLLREKESFERESKAAIDALGLAEKELSANEDQKKFLLDSVETLGSDLRHCEEQILAEIHRLGFAEEQAFKNALPDFEKVDEIKARRKALNDEIQQSLAKIEEVKLKLDELKDFSEFDLEARTKELNKIGEICEEFRQKIAADKHALGEDEKNRQKLGEKADQIAAQQKEFDRWSLLKALIGSAEGDLFRKFAQGLTLEILVELANQKLRLFNNRYLLCRQSPQNMGLEIVDTYQADIRRPVTTLSGGESFLVSLALALGLSELASKRIKIESLFLDEGFGTLDAETLDTALYALNQLQSEGRTIGVISHVESLKERVPVQIQVTPVSAGYSSISLSG